MRYFLINRLRQLKNEVSQFLTNGFSWNWFYGIFHVMHREPKMFIGLVSSWDGTHWDRNPQYVLSPKEIHLADGGVIIPDRFEGPSVDCENGDPLVPSMGYRKGDDMGWVFILLGKK